MSTKVVSKRDPDEKVGVIGRIDGAMGCIEYSDLPADLRAARGDDGELLFRAGNIAVHVLGLDFVRGLTRERLELPWHLATKKMKVVDEEGQPAERTGTKFESFVFDALSRSPASVTLEVDRALEFSPVKNAEGQDSPETCRRDLVSLFGGWVRALGEEPHASAVEVDPLVAEDRDEFVARAPHQPAAEGRGASVRRLSEDPRLRPRAASDTLHASARARVAELVDAMDSKSISRKGVGVRVPSLVPTPPVDSAGRDAHGFLQRGTLAARDRESRGRTGLEKTVRRRRSSPRSSPAL